MTKYHVPIIGWAIAAVEYQIVNRAYWRAIESKGEAWSEFQSTMVAYENTVTGFIVTAVTLAAGLLLVTIAGMIPLPKGRLRAVMPWVRLVGSAFAVRHIDRDVLVQAIYYASVARISRTCSLPPDT